MDIARKEALDLQNTIKNTIQVLIIADPLAPSLLGPHAP